MKQLAQYQDGRLELQEVPAPVAPPGGILVRTVCSVISPGTEKMKVEQARMSLLQKAKARPDQVKKVLDTARTLGWRSALEKVRNRLESPSPLGYSAAGVVVAVDEANTRFRVGDRVACGGAECAFHAEVIAVPDLLAARVPDEVSDASAAFTTLASISMQAVRQSAAGLGDRVVVVGQGLVGQLATAMLAAAGARVLAVDLVPQRLAVATKMGAERVFCPGESRMEEVVDEWSVGLGADAVLICVGGKGAAVTEAAVAALRDRGVMVIVGIYDVELPWRSACMKDIQVRYSRSYGPGRYDPEYEWAGKDYPVGYVRWTENRQFEACLHLMKSGVLDLRPVTTREVRFEEVVPVYESLLQPENADLGVVVRYGSISSGILPEGRAAGILPVELRAGETPAALASGETPDPRGSGRMPELHCFVPFDPEKDTDKKRRNLPHWEQEGATQFVTFRLADAVAHEKLRVWTRERDAWLMEHPRPWDEATAEAFREAFPERLEQWLDAGQGSCLLARPDVARLMEGAMRHFDGDRYVLDEFVIMPNHVHVLVKPLPGHDLSGIMHSWKSFTSREIKKLVGLQGDEPLWQAERFDHALRSETALEAKRRYIRENPVKARLADGYRLGCGVGLVGSSGILPEGRAAGILPVELRAGETPAALASGETPDPHASGRMPELHVVGAGNFVRTMLLPHLKGKIPLGVVVNQTGLSSRQAKEKFGFAAAETDAVRVLEMAGHGPVVIGTRHHLHASQVLKALAAGRDVFVEKPLCLTREQLHEIDAAIAVSRGSVMVGFNRRFAPATIELLRVLQSVPGPRSLAFHVFAGPLAPDHWYANVAESGGRVLGEACHFFDFACCLLGRPTRVSAQTVGRPDVPDSISAQVEFADGSSAQILYSAAGDPAFPKESFRVFAGGVVVEGENFQVLKIHQNRKVKVKKFSGKGHAEEMAAWLSFLNGTTKHPLPYAQSRQSMALTFAALESIRERRMVEL